MIQAQRNRAETTVPRPIAIDLFSGVGGLSLGLEQAGFDVALAVEIDERHGRYAQYNAPHTTVLYGERYGDIRKVTRGKVRPLLPHDEVSLIAGGPPCQGFSLAGKKNPNDPLNTLVIEFARIVSGIRPKAFLIENVPGITSKNNPHLAAALTRLSRSYTVSEPHVLRAEQFGVPQSRRRVFVLGIRKDLAVRPSLPSPTHFWGDASGSLFRDLLATPPAKDALADLPSVDDYAELIDGDIVGYERAPATTYARVLRGCEIDPDDRSYSVNWDSTQCTNSRRTRHGASLLERFHSLGFGQKDPTSGIVRVRPDGLFPTIRAGTTSSRGSWSAPRPLHPHQDRVLTTRECARAQSFPDWFRFHPAKWHGNMQVGNAVPPKLARAIGVHLLEILGIPRPSKPAGRIERDDDLVRADIEAASNSNLSTRKVSQKVLNTRQSARRD